MVKPSKKSTTATTQPSNPEIEERTRLKRLAIANHQLSATATATAAGFAPLAPAKTVVKHHGKDILKKSQRKNRFLFSFPGLIAPVEGGRIGELTDLGSRNPKLYLEFPQGRMKLLGTIVYPNNRYLTLQFSKGGKNVICDDCFDAMIVFSDAFWIGRKDDNPDEARLDFPEELYKGQHAECNFQGGAGATAMKGHNSNKVIKGPAEQESPGSDLEPESPEKVDKLNSKLDITPARHSERTAGKTFKFAEVSSGDDSANSGSEISGGEEAEEADRSCAHNQGVDEPDHHPMRTSFAGKQQSRPTSVMEIPRSTTSESNMGFHKGHGPLTQATISTLFKKAGDKMAPGDTNDAPLQEASSEKSQKTSLQKTKRAKVVIQIGFPSAGESRMKKNLSSKKIAGSRSSTRKNDEIDEDDDIEEFSSSSPETDGSDDDWAE